MATLGVLAACTPEPELTVASFVLRFPPAEACRPPDEVRELSVEALGDFPASDARTIELLRPDDGARDIDRFPAETQLVTVRARSDRWEGVGARFVRGDVLGPLLLAPVDRSCPSPDPALALEGGVAVALPDGGLALAGGSDGALGTRRLVRLDPGESLARVLGGLDQRRSGHALLVVRDELWVVGGALGTTGPAHDTWERFSVDGAPLAGGVLQTPRRDFGALVLPDGRILLVGGRSSAEGEPLANAEVLDLNGTSSTIEAPFARIAPHVVRTDEGVVVVLGGVGTGGATVLQPIYVLDPTSLVFVPHEVSIPRWAAFDVAPLPGGRLALVGDAREGLEPMVVLLQVRDLGLGVEIEAETLPLPLPPSTGTRVAALPDGSLLVLGSSDAGPLASHVDPSTGVVRALETSRAVQSVIALADGSVAELGESGASFRRPRFRSTFSNPPATLLGEDLALGSPNEWRSDGAALVAEVDEARASVATLRFASFVLSLNVEGSAEVLLGPERGGVVAIRARAGELGPALCTIPRVDGEEMRIERMGSRITLSTPAGTRTCTVDGLGERVSLGFRASRGARLSRIALSRVP